MKSRLEECTLREKPKLLIEEMPESIQETVLKVLGHGLITNKNYEKVDSSYKE